MPEPSASLKVFLYHWNADPSAVQALRSRLLADGVHVRLVDDVKLSPAESVDVNRVRASAIADAVWETDVVLICLSKDMAAGAEEIGHVVKTAALKEHGELFLVPVRFENNEIPETLMRWQVLDMFEPDGYEKLMLTLQLRAERLGLVLNPRKGWQEPLQLAQNGDLLPDWVFDPKIIRMVIGVAVLAVAFFAVLGFSRLFKQVAGRTVTVNEMVENSTQSANERAENLSMTQTAIMLTIRAPVTQTAIAEETLQHPPTATLQFPTIIALPTEIIAPGNIRMVYVPGENIMLGNENDTTGAIPAHSVYVEPFYIDKYEVTNALYRVCVDVGACEPPMSFGSYTHAEYYGTTEFSDYPVVNVTWNMAKQYCEWRGTYLPGEAEWEMAARSFNGRTYPWGEEAGCQFANYGDTVGRTCIGDTTAVGNYADGQSLYGAFDMAGNVSEWVNSLYWAYPYVSTDGRESSETPGLRVVRGGNWASPLKEITAYYRSGIDPSTSDSYTGFRCAHDAHL